MQKKICLNSCREPSVLLANICKDLGQRAFIGKVSDKLETFTYCHNVQQEMYAIFLIMVPFMYVV